MKNYYRHTKLVCLLITAFGAHVTVNAQTVDESSVLGMVSVGARVNGDFGPGAEIAYQFSERAQAFVFGFYQNSHRTVGFGVDSSGSFERPLTFQRIDDAYSKLAVGIGARLFAKPGNRGFYIAPALGYAYASGYSDELNAALTRPDYYISSYGEAQTPERIAGSDLLVMSEVGYRLVFLRRLVYAEIGASGAALIPNRDRPNDRFGSMSIGLGANLSFFQITRR